MTANTNTSISTSTSTSMFRVTLTRAQARAMSHVESLYADGQLHLAAASANKQLAILAAPVARREGFKALFEKATAKSPENFSGVARWFNAELDAMPDDVWHCGAKQSAVLSHEATLVAWADGRYDKTARTEKVLEARARKIEQVRHALDLINEWRTVEAARRDALASPAKPLAKPPARNQRSGAALRAAPFTEG